MAINEPLFSINQVSIPPYLEQLEKFQAQLQKLSGDNEKFKLCITTRNELLESHADIEALIAGFDSVMSAECELYRNNKAQFKERRRSDQYDDEDVAQWDRFIGVATSGNGNFKACLGPLMRVSKSWGKEKILHYGWHARGEKYCKELGATANVIFKWDDAKVKLNQLILRRINAPGSRVVRQDINPIDQVDLVNLRSWKQEEKYVRHNDPKEAELSNRELSVDEVPDGYGFDKFGLLVREDFAVSTARMVPQNTRGSQQDGQKDENRESSRRKSLRNTRVLSDGHDDMTLRPRHKPHNYAGMSKPSSRIAKSKKQGCCTDIPADIQALLDKSLESKDSIRSAQPYVSKLCHKHLQKYTVLLSSLIFSESSDSISQRNSSSPDPIPNRRRTASAASLGFNSRPEEYTKGITPSNQGICYNSELAEDIRSQVLEDLKQRLPLLPEGSHELKHSRQVHALLSRASPARDGAEVHFLPGTQAAKLLESADNNRFHVPIITYSQQAFQWDESSRPIEQLFERMGGLQHSISVKIPSGDGECKTMALADIHERFVSNRETTEPLHISDLYSPVLGTLPAFLMGENCQLLSRVHDLLLMSDCEAISWKTRKKIEGFAILSEGGHNTIPHMDIQGYATWITVQEGNVGFGWMSDPTPNERRSWISNPQNTILGQWKFVVLSPGQSIFFDSGSIRFTFQVKNTQSLILSGHILRWTHIVSWFNLVTDQEQNMSSLTAAYIEAVNTLVDHNKSLKSSNIIEQFKNRTLQRGPSKSPYVVIKSSEGHQEVQYHDATLDANSLSRLTGDSDNGYLDDQLVLFYLRFLHDQVTYRGAPDCAVIDPVIMQSIMDFGIATLKNGSPFDIFTPEFVIIPMFHKDDYQHWYLAIICHPRSLLKDSESHEPIPRLILLDSLFEERPKGEEILRDLIIFEAQRREKSIRMDKLHVSSAETFKDQIPGQPPSNGNDCGLYILIYCEKFLMNPMDFIQRFAAEGAPFNKEEWGNLQSQRVRKRYNDLIQRFIGSSRRNGALIDVEGVEIIDGRLGPDGRGLMRGFK